MRAEGLEAGGREVKIENPPLKKRGAGGVMICFVTPSVPLNLREM